MKLDTVVTLGIVGAIGWALFKDHGAVPAKRSTSVAAPGAGRVLALSAPSSGEDFSWLGFEAEEENPASSQDKE